MPIKSDQDVTEHRHHDFGAHNLSRAPVQFDYGWFDISYSFFDL
jgi:hypothetical protein